MITAHDAMEWAIQSGRSGDIEIARFWLDVARELREGSAAPAGPEVMMPVKAVQRDTTALRRPDDRPGEAIDGAGERCVHCGYFLDTSGWAPVHTRTGQRVCPVGKPGPDDTVIHTYATLDDATQAG